MDAYYLCLGIHPSEQPPNHYRLAGLRLFESQSDVIQTACDRQMAHLAAFQHGPYAELAQRLFAEVTAARMCLLRPDLKAAYDEQLMQLLAAGQTPRHAESTPLPVQAAPQTAPEAFDDSQDEDETWDSAEEIRPARRARRARRNNEGGHAALGLAAIVIVSVGAAVVWRALSQPPAGADIQRTSMQQHQEGPQQLTKKEPPRRISKARRPAPGFDSASGPDAAEIQPSAPAVSMPHDPTGAPPVAPAFASRLDPRMNPDLASILGSDDAGDTLTDQQVAGLRDWEDEAPFNSKLGGFDPINLGSGLVLSMAIVDVSPDSAAMMVPAEGDVFARKNSDGAVTGVFSSVRGALEGPAMELSAENRLTLFGAYEQDKRDGDFRICGEQQKRLLYSRYSRDAKQGLTCVFKNGLPRYVQVSSGRRTQDEFLIRFTGRKPKVIAKRDFSPEDEFERPIARARLAALESSLASRERIYRKQLAAWWTGVKIQRATASVSGKKPNASLRGQTRHTGDSATFSTLLRGALAP